MENKLNKNLYILLILLFIFVLFFIQYKINYNNNTNYNNNNNNNNNNLKIVCSIIFILVIELLKYYFKIQSKEIIQQELQFQHEFQLQQDQLNYLNLIYQYQIQPYQQCQQYHQPIQSSQQEQINYFPIIEQNQIQQNQTNDLHFNVKNQQPVYQCNPHHPYIQTINSSQQDDQPFSVKKYQFQQMKLQIEFNRFKNYNLNQPQEQLFTKKQSQQQHDSFNNLHSNDLNQIQPHPHPHPQPKKPHPSKIINLHSPNRVLKKVLKSCISRKQNRFNNSIVFKVNNEIKIVKNIKYNKLNRTKNIKILIKKILNQIKVVPHTINSKQQTIGSTSAHIDSKTFGSVSTQTDVQTIESLPTPMDIQTLESVPTPMDFQTLESVPTDMDTQTLYSVPTQMDIQTFGSLQMDTQNSRSTQTDFQCPTNISPNSEINYKEIKIIKKLGSGGCGTVYMGEYKNSKVAIKRSTDSSASSFENEIELTKKFNHGKIVKYIGTAIDVTGEKLMVTELLKQEVANLISMKPNLPIYYKVKMALDIAYGIKEIHSNEVIHRDLKLENLMVDDNDEVKIIDFGISCDTRKIETLKSLYLGTIQYMAPEIFLNKGFTKSVDIYSFGVILFEIISSRRVGRFLENMPTQEANRYLLDHKFLPNFNGIQEFYDDCNLKFLVERCWNPNPRNRPTACEIIFILNKSYQNYQKMFN